MTRAFVVVAALAMVLAGCSSDDEPDPSAAPTTTSTTVATTTTITAPAEEGIFADCPSRPQGSSPAAFDPASGTYSSTIEGLDVERLRLRFDVVQWLSGQDADDAYHEEFPDDPEGVPNDYFIRNRSPEVREASVAPDAEVLVLARDGGAQIRPETVPGLAAHVPQSLLPIYWLTFSDGTITGICQQYQP